MKKQLLFVMVSAGFMQLNAYAQDNNALQNTGNVGIGTTNPETKLEVRGKVKIDSTLVVKDSVTIQKSLRVEEDVYFLGQTEMNNVKVWGNFSSETNNILGGIVRFPHLNPSNDLASKTVVMTDATGLAQKVSFDTVAMMLRGFVYSSPVQVDFYCTQVAPTAPNWMNGPYKLFSKCPDVKVGIGTDAPTHGLHVINDARLNRARIDLNLGIGAEANTAAALLVKNDSHASGLYIKQGGNTTPNQKLLHFEYDEPYTEILRATNTQTGTVSHQFHASGRTTIHNGERKIFQLENDGLLRVRRVKVDVDNWADFVFDDSYTLMPLTEVETFVKREKHLPGIPSEQELKENGMDVQQMNMQLMQKVEELTLYLIEQNKEIETLKQRLGEVEANK